MVQIILYLTKMANMWISSFISHMVQIIRVLMVFTGNLLSFISHMVQIIRGRGMEKQSNYVSFISHMVQIIRYQVVGWYKDA